jgi:leucyl-tRNA synthetase
MLREVRSILLDISTAPIENAAEFIDRDSIEPPDSYVKPEAIEAYKDREFKKRMDKTGLDLDLARITGIGWQRRMPDGELVIDLCRDDQDECDALATLATVIGHDQRLISYNGLSFDWPMLMRRARYLGVPFPVINCDRYKSPHIDLMALLSLHDPSRRRSLGFYARRLGMGLSKPLSGAEEAQVPVSGRWQELEASLRHDVEALHKLAVWAGVL